MHTPIFGQDNIAGRLQRCRDMHRVKHSTTPLRPDLSARLQDFAAHGHSLDLRIFREKFFIESSDLGLAVRQRFYEDLGQGQLACHGNDMIIVDALEQRGELLGKIRITFNEVDEDVGIEIQARPGRDWRWIIHPAMPE